MIGPGVKIGTSTVGDSVGVGGTGLGVIVAVLLGMGLSVGEDGSVGAVAWSAQAVRSSINR